MPEALESDDMPLHETPTESPERLTCYDRIRGDNLAPLWQVFSTLITTEPKSDCRSHIWRYKMLRDRLMEASNLISAKEAERQVLILENPGFAGEARITTSLFSGGQLVLPGEVAPAHRHSQSALRFIVEGSGDQTAVDGERTIMEEGDFVITPPWSWHDHGNDSDAPMIWLDGLNISLVRLFDTFLPKVTRQTSNRSRHRMATVARATALKYCRSIIDLLHRYRPSSPIPMPGPGRPWRR